MAPHRHPAGSPRHRFPHLGALLAGWLVLLVPGGPGLGWEAAQGDDRATKTFKNTLLGETWQESGEAPDWQRLYDRREEWAPGTVASESPL